MTHTHQLPGGVDTPAVLDHRIDELLLQARGLALVRDLLTTRGASTREIDAHSRELESTTKRLADLIGGTASRDGQSPVSPAR